jgi:two-component system, NtrC family, response regulator HydG
VDDDAEAARALGQSLVRQGYFCELARTTAAALTLMARAICDVAICEARLGTGQALQPLDLLKTAYPLLPVIVLATSGTTSEAVTAIKHGAFQYLVKPYPVADLHRHIRQAVVDREEFQLRTASDDAAAWGGEIVHESLIMEELLETMALVALSTAPVLLVGETGSGKERVARAIHARGPRRSRPFVAVNTTAIPEQLLESELFGHVRGAYTGALQSRTGLFAEADGGTLLLDEIGDMPMGLQPKLLRVLQFGEARSLGSDRARHVNVRIIAATQRDLSDLVREGQFRDDLRYRLNTLALHVPPLRERRKDIAALARQFLSAARVRSPSSPVTSIDAEAMLILEQAPWRGNVRELESVVERLVVLGRQPIVTPHQLSFLDSTPGAEAAEPWPRSNGRHLTLRQMNQRYLDWVLEQTEGDKTRAAEALGIDISTLYRWQRAKN